MLSLSPPKAVVFVVHFSACEGEGNELAVLFLFAYVLLPRNLKS